MKQILSFLIMFLISFSCTWKNRDLSKHELISSIEAKVGSLRITGFPGNQTGHQLVDSLLYLDPKNKTGMFFKAMLLTFSDSSKKALPFLKFSLQRADSLHVPLNLAIGVCFEKLEIFDSSNFYFQKVLDQTGDLNQQNKSFKPHLVSVLYGKQKGIKYIEESKDKMTNIEFKYLMNNLNDFVDGDRFDHFFPSFYYVTSKKVKFELEIDSIMSKDIDVNSMSDLRNYLVDKGINIEVNGVSHNLDSNSKTYNIETVPRFIDRIDNLELSGLKKL